jgi:hypothetical protein
MNSKRRSLAPGRNEVHDHAFRQDGGTGVEGIHENLPTGGSIADNETGWRMALGKLAAYVEGQQLCICLGAPPGLCIGSLYDGKCHS